MSGVRTLYRVAQLPVFQNRMFDSCEAARACPRGDLDIVQDDATGLIFNRAFDPSLLVYDADYQNEQGHSAAFRAHLDAVAQCVMRHFHGSTLIEVGCGKGHFLAVLQGLGFAVTGLDPAYEGSNPAIRRECFTPATGLRADGLILRHVLEHLRDPYAFLCQLRDANGGTGKVYIEVPCVDWIARQHAWFDLFYEHVNYFRLADFSRLFGTLHEAGHCFGGQYLYAVADLASLREPVAGTDARFEFPPAMQADVARTAARLKAARLAGRPDAAVWGGASKGVIFSLLMARAGVPPALVVDINPAKQGRFIAASGLRVHSAEEALAHLAPGTDVFVMNPNYLDEIQALTKHRFNCISLEQSDGRDNL